MAGKTCPVQTVNGGKPAVVVVITEATQGMTPDRSSTTRRRKLGLALQRLRTEAGMTQAVAAGRINIKDNLLSRFEKGARSASVSHVIALCKVYGADPAFTDVLVQLARDAGERSWWVADHSTAVPDWFAGYLDLETDASQVSEFEIGCVPGLLQTPEYVRHVEARDVGANVTRLREGRQGRLQGDDPLVFRAVIDEAVLRRAVGGPDVMRGQLRHLADTAALSNVTLRVLPLSVGHHPAMSGSFVVLQFPDPSMDTVYVELVGGALYADKPADVTRYKMTFERLMDQALGGEETMSFLHEVERELE